uniref:Uncharacterized protein n=1 Tax=Glossina brevipalpis TaxID=37001 RepID=A0A1A9WBQ0_9MUSC
MDFEENINVTQHSELLRTNGTVCSRMKMSFLGAQLANWSCNVFTINKETYNYYLQKIYFQENFDYCGILLSTFVIVMIDTYEKPFMKCLMKLNSMCSSAYAPANIVLSVDLVITITIAIMNDKNPVINPYFYSHSHGEVRSSRILARD